MPVSLDSQIVRSKFNELFSIGHKPHNDVVPEFDVHHQVTDWKEHGPLHIHHAAENKKLIRFEFDTKFDANVDDSQKKLEERLQYIRKFLSTMMDPGEEYHLLVEERPHINDADGATTFIVRGVIVPQGTYPGGVTPLAERA